ncbi:MAG: F-type H+-transporting ATPase subunit beta [bacterium]|nr:MAG: F-type H+-transporting ATPase subunit beta [bacterium]
MAMEQARGNGTSGRIIAVQGPVVDVKFASSREVPNVYDVIESATASGQPLVMEVAEHLPGHVARCIALTSTLNVRRSAPARPTGAAVTIPTGNALFGRIINVLGQPIDRKGHRDASDPPAATRRKNAQPRAARPP